MYFLHTPICTRYSGINKSNHRKLTRDIGFNFIIVSLALKLNFTLTGSLTVTKMSKKNPFLILPFSFLDFLQQFSIFLIEILNFQHWTWLYRHNLWSHVQNFTFLNTWRDHTLTWPKQFFAFNLLGPGKHFTQNDYVGLYWFGISVQDLIDIHVGLIDDWFYAPFRLFW